MPRVLWVDLRTSSSERYCHAIEDGDCCHLFHHAGHDGIDGISEAIRRVEAQVLFLEYDFPDAVGLRILQSVKSAFPSVPLFMLTDEHSVELTIWAFRSGVRDFFIKPVDRAQIASRLASLPELRRSGSSSRSNILPQQPIPMAARYATPSLPRTTRRALRYIDAHLNERITLEAMAKLCGMSPFQFCRTFRQEHGINFKEFLTRKRVAKAQELLANPRAAVADVAFAVGFSDPPYFTKVFRRVVGRAPSECRAG